FKCLADETWARMTLLIARASELCVGELTNALHDSQAKISGHLAQLRNCGVLEDRRHGQWVYSPWHPNLPDWVHEIIDATLAANKNWLRPNTERLEGMRERPERATACS